MNNNQYRISHAQPASYNDLAQFHFIKSPPATITRLIAATHNNKTIGLVTESFPTLQCKLRNLATNDRYGRHLSNHQRAAMLKSELRTISRVIVHPRWRNQYVASNLIQFALNNATTPLTEAISVIGNKSNIFSNAGMTPYQRHHHPADQKLLDALSYINIYHNELEFPQKLAYKIHRLPQHHKNFITHNTTAL